MNQVLPERHASLTLSPKLQEWLTEGILRGVHPTKLTDSLSKAGVDGVTAAEHVKATMASPIFRAAARLCRNQQKFVSLLEALSAQYRQSGYVDNIPLREGLSAAEFYDRYYFTNRPVIVRGLMTGWEALNLWTPDYFASEFGNCEVEITSDRDSDERYEENFDRHRSAVLMREYVSMIQNIETNNFYLVAKNNLLERGEFRKLYQHFSCPPGFLDPAAVEHHVKMWFGPKGTVTPLHHDGCNIFFGQICGRKRVQLISPYDITKVYNDRECFSAVDLDCIDYDRFPQMLDVSILDVVIEPGDFILLPLGWWHWVKSIDVCVSLSFTNFSVEGGTVVWRYR